MTSTSIEDNVEALGAQSHEVGAGCDRDGTRYEVVDATRGLRM